MTELRLDNDDALDLIERAPFLPAVIWSAGQRAYWNEATPTGYGSSRDEAQRYTLAQAYRKSGGMRSLFELVDYFSLDIPMPPSTNALFVEAAGRKKGSGRQRVKTSAYKSWINGAALVARRALVRAGANVDEPIFAENFGLWIRLNVNHNSDISNRVKAVEDLLGAMGVTIDDCWNDRLLVERDRTIKADCRVVIYREVQA